MEWKFLSLFKNIINFFTGFFNLIIFVIYCWKSLDTGVYKWIIKLKPKNFFSGFLDPLFLFKITYFLKQFLCKSWGKASFGKAASGPLILTICSNFSRVDKNVDQRKKKNITNFGASFRSRIYRIGPIFLVQKAAKPKHLRAS